MSGLYRVKRCSMYHFYVLHFFHKIWINVVIIIHLNILLNRLKLVDFSENIQWIVHQNEEIWICFLSINTEWFNRIIIHITRLGVLYIFSSIFIYLQFCFYALRHLVQLWIMYAVGIILMRLELFIHLWKTCLQ